MVMVKRRPFLTVRLGSRRRLFLYQLAFTCALAVNHFVRALLLQRRSNLLLKVYIWFVNTTRIIVLLVYCCFDACWPISWMVVYR